LSSLVSDVAVGLGSGVCVGSSVGVSVGTADWVRATAAAVEAAAEACAWAGSFVAAAGELQLLSSKASSPATNMKNFIFELRSFRMDPDLADLRGL
jgi:hypothetical protein